MKKWGIWGANTNKTGLPFEEAVDIYNIISQLDNYEIKNWYEIFYLSKKVWEIYKKHDLYKYLLKPKWIDYKEYLSSKLLPDSAIYVIIRNTLYIIEVKKQWGTGSTDEKLQTSDFKRKQYQRLVSSLWIKVEFCFILDERFKDKKYNDVLNYILAMWDKYFRWTLPLDYISIFKYVWLPTPK